MAVAVEQFRARFPEFDRTDSALLAQHLAQAEGRVNRTLYGDDRADTAVMLLAAHLTALTPYGEKLRLNPNKEPDGALTTYERTLRTMQRELAIAPALV